MEFVGIGIIILIITNIIINLSKGGTVEGKDSKKLEPIILKTLMLIEQNEKTIRDEFERNGRETNEKFMNQIKHQSEYNINIIGSVERIEKTIEKQLERIREDNNNQLEEMRITVDEKLQKTINDRLSQSFETVGKQLQSVQEGLGEMKTLATDVGGLKKVLSNVKLRGGLGELQLSMLLDQILSPEQYEANVKTKKGSANLVEFAVKLPGNNEELDNIWLPIDAKFPKDVYEQLVEAYDSTDVEQIKTAKKNLTKTIKNMAKDISDKYIDPPYTTDFGIMFLPFEGIYAEAVRDSALIEELQRKYKIIITGPTTLGAILNSLQVGFKTLSIQKRSGEVWNVLVNVEKEFEKFGGLLEKAQKNIQTGLNNIDDVLGVRTRSIQKQLTSVGSFDGHHTIENK